MSKQLGNSPDPLELIGKFGADGVRVGMLLSSPAGNDLPFDSSQCEQGRNFTNKIWNAFRLVQSWEVKDFDQPESSKIAKEWLSSKLAKTITSLNDQYDKFRISEALMTTYKFIWDDFCSWYLEMIKPSYQQPVDQQTFNDATGFFEVILKLTHPFTPFIAEEIWHLIKERDEKDCVVVASWPIAPAQNDKLLSNFSIAEEIITNIRNVRISQNIANKVLIDLNIKENETFDKSFDCVIAKLGNLSSLNYVTEKVDNAFSFIVKSNEYFIPFSEEVDVEAEMDKLKDELKYTKGFLIGVQKKLSNERFVSNAPEQVVANEKQKLADAEAKIKVLEEKLSSFV